MLFVLSGDIQTGKTRWLCDVCDDVAGLGVVPFGVLAPGLWRDPVQGNDVVRPSGGFACMEAAAIDWDAMPQAPVDANGFEKMGICNTLMPQRETLLFALRRDVAVACGRLHSGSQSEKAQLGWHMSDEAIARVDAHFSTALEKGMLAAAGISDAGLANDGSENVDTNAASIADEVHGSGAGTESPKQTCKGRVLLVVDELGRLELLRDEGLTSAMALLEAGPTPECPHALVVARAGLSQFAEHRFADRWKGSLYLYPNEDGRLAILGAVRHAQQDATPHAW